MPNGSDPTFEVDLIFAAMLIPVLVYAGAKHIRHRASAQWPMVPASLMSSEVKVWKSNRGGETRSIFLKFTYSAGDRTYDGWYCKLLLGYQEAEADRLLESLRNGPLYVRYKPSRPKTYVCDPFRDVWIGTSK